MNDEIKRLAQMFGPKFMIDPEFRNNFAATLLMYSPEIQTLLKTFVNSDEEYFNGEIEIEISKLTTYNTHVSTMSRFIEWNILSKRQQTDAKAQVLVHWKDNAIIKTIYVEINITNVYFAAEPMDENNIMEVKDCASFTITIKHDPRLNLENNIIRTCFCGDW